MNAIVSLLTDITRWSWRAVLALVLIAAAYYVPRLVAVSAGVGDILDTWNLIGLALAASEIARARKQDPPSVVVSDQRGHVRVDTSYVVIGLAALAFLLMLVAAGPGCASTLELHGKTAIHERWAVGPPCRMEFRVDDEKEPRVILDAPAACPPPVEMCPVKP